MQNQVWKRFGSIENLKLATAKLNDLEDQVRSCTKCPLYKTRTNGVPGSGPVTARIMAVGEAPGANEDIQGKPFVGAAGKLLTKLLLSIGLDRNDIYITNVIKSRPPENRDPNPEEVAACAPYLDQQIEIINPDVILLLGRHAMNRLFDNMPPISKAHGQKMIINKRLYVPLYHPAAALYNGGMLSTLEADMQKVKGYLEEIEAARNS